MLVTLYLVAIVAANLLSARFGPSVSIFNAFVLIGLDLSARDGLHEKWRKHLYVKMGALILAGSAISYIIARVFGGGPLLERIALASCIAFGSAALVDAVAYHFLRRRPWLLKSNGSNVLAAAVDSLIFPTIAF